MNPISLNTSQKMKSTAAGDIPVDWECVQLKFLVDSLVSGVSVSGEDRVSLNTDKKLLKVSAVTSGKFKGSAFKSVDEEIGKRLKRKIKGNTILVNRANGSKKLVGSAVYISEINDTLYFPDKIWQIAPNESTANGPFLGYLLSSHKFRNNVISRCSGGTGMMNIGSKSYLSIRIASPPLPEQRKIAEILSTWDEALEKLDALILAKQQRKKALIQQLLTGKKRLPGFDGKWKSYKLGNLFEQRKETKRGDLPLLSITASQGVINRKQLAKKDSSNADKSKYQRIGPGDIGYNTMRMWQGVSALSSLEGIVSPAYTICTPTENITGEFTAHFFKLTHTISLFHRYSQGLVADTLNLKYPNFSVIEISIPPTTEEQTAIANILTTCDEELTLLHKQRKTIDKQKRGLMQQLLTGKTRVTP